ALDPIRSGRSHVEWLRWQRRGRRLPSLEKARLTREQTGRTLQEHLAIRRVAEARRLLMTGDLPLRDIAAAAGFADQSHLGLVFRRLTGMTPRRFRAVGGA
ncbi:MAG: helix-turn-helix transcriptional regulator, partial [Planctomycetes bacterium]|nr:helix-turn-helix transcriptional regulator [Planctomycetota bacterium]